MDHHVNMAGTTKVKFARRYLIPPLFRHHGRSLQRLSCSLMFDIASVAFEIYLPPYSNNVSPLPIKRCAAFRPEFGSSRGWNHRHTGIMTDKHYLRRDTGSMCVIQVLIHNPDHNPIPPGLGPVWRRCSFHLPCSIGFYFVGPAELLDWETTG